MRGLVSMDVCTEIDGSRFRLTSLGEYLRPNHPDSVEARVLLHGQVFYPMWEKLSETLRTGESGSQRAFGVPLYEHLMKEPRVGMTSVISNSAAAQILPERGQSEPAAVDLGADVHAHQATQDRLDG